MNLPARVRYEMLTGFSGRYAAYDTPRIVSCRASRLRRVGVDKWFQMVAVPLIVVGSLLASVLLGFSVIPAVVVSALLVAVAVMSKRSRRGVLLYRKDLLVCHDPFVSWAECYQTHSVTFPNRAAIEEHLATLIGLVSDRDDLLRATVGQLDPVESEALGFLDDQIGEVLNVIRHAYTHGIRATLGKVTTTEEVTSAPRRRKLVEKIVTEAQERSAREGLRETECCPEESPATMTAWT